MLENNPNVVFLRSPLGIIGIEGDKQFIRRISFRDKIDNENPSQLLLVCKQQLLEYFNHMRKVFEVPLQPAGSPFQKEVWTNVMNIPHGQTSTYSSISRDLGNYKKARAVGMANSKNPIAIIIPCHRVIGSNGALTGYIGGLDRKKWLLDREKEHAQLSLFN